MRKLYFICSIVLLIAIFNLPLGYYTFLRIIITISAILIILNEVKKVINFLGFTFLFVAIIFNPFWPIYLYNKSFWIPIDIATAVLFLIYGLKEEK